jgi:hypothetical protein
VSGWKPGISVVSSGGHTVTTIDGTGSPASGDGTRLPSNFAPLAGSTQCATVVFGTGFVNADILDGFKIRGGSGRRDLDPKMWAAGSSWHHPHDLQQPDHGRRALRTQRIFPGGHPVNAAICDCPVITRTIDGNRATPAGT